MKKFMFLICMWNVAKLPKVVHTIVESCPKYEPKGARHIAYDLNDVPLVPDEFIKGNLTAQRMDSFQVPNIVHYIWYRNETKELRFDQALSILSAIKNLKPDAVYFHTNKEPNGKYFDMLKKYSIFKVVYREPPKSIIKEPPYETLYADYDKVKILIEQGGIYLDLDVMVVRSFDEVRKYGCTVGLEDHIKVCSGVIICAKEHRFLYVWLDTYYDDYEQYKDIWAFHAGNVPSVLVKRYPHLVHVEPYNFHVPNYKPEGLEYIWGNKTFAWKEHYAVHTWIRKSLLPLPTEISILTMNSTYGEMARQVFYGTKTQTISVHNKS